MKRAYVVLLAAAGIAAGVALVRQIKPKPAEPERLGAVSAAVPAAAPPEQPEAPAAPDPCRDRCEPLLRDAQLGASSYFRCVTACRNPLKLKK